MSVGYFKLSKKVKMPERLPVVGGKLLKPLITMETAGGNKYTLEGAC